jgi:hypothetical protein
MRGKQTKPSSRKRDTVTTQIIKTAVTTIDCYLETVSIEQLRKGLFSPTTEDIDAIAEDLGRAPTREEISEFTSECRHEIIYR